MLCVCPCAVRICIVYWALGTARHLAVEAPASQRSGAGYRGNSGCCVFCASGLRASSLCHPPPPPRLQGFMEQLEAAEKAQTSDTADDNTAVAAMAADVRAMLRAPCHGGRPSEAAQTQQRLFLI